MDRLTYDYIFGGSHCWQVKGADNLMCNEVCEAQKPGCIDCPIAKAFDRLAAIEDILGDEYDLDELREMVQAKREGRCVVLPIKVPGWGWYCNREYPNAISAYFAYPSQVVDCMEKYVLKESKEEAEKALRREQE